LFLLDTNVVSELRKVRAGKASPRVARWASGIDAADMFVSAITIHELELGVLLAERKDPPQGVILRKWLDRKVLPAFDGRILPVDTDVARRSARLHVPNPHALRDGLIAATALIHGFAVGAQSQAVRNSPRASLHLVARDDGGFLQRGGFPLLPGR
jgi:hypothetical protein